MILWQNNPTLFFFFRPLFFIELIVILCKGNAGARGETKAEQGTTTRARTTEK